MMSMQGWEDGGAQKNPPHGSKEDVARLPRPAVLSSTPNPPTDPIAHTPHYALSQAVLKFTTVFAKFRDVLETHRPIYKSQVIYFTRQMRAGPVPSTEPQGHTKRGRALGPCCNSCSCCAG